MQRIPHSRCGACTVGAMHATRHVQSIAVVLLAEQHSLHRVCSIVLPNREVLQLAGSAVARGGIHSMCMLSLLPQHLALYAPSCCCAWRHT